MNEIYAALSLDQSVEVINRAKLDSCFAVSDLAAHSIGAVGLALAELVKATNLTSDTPKVTVDQGIGIIVVWPIYSASRLGNAADLDAIAGDYPTNDGWIKLHTNLDHHRGAALSVLGCAAERTLVAAEVKQWKSAALENSDH